MLNANDLEQLKAKGISEKQIEEQLACFVKGFPFLEIAASASVEKGIMVISKEEQASYMDAWDAYLAKNKKIVKFVPASGAASRMFKNLYEFLSADYKEPMNAFEKKFFSEIEKFAFYKALDKKCVENTGKDIPALVALGKYKEVVSNLLEPKGLNYGQLPKGLLLFHKYADTVRTAMEEHLAEGAMYAKNNAGEVNIHFTVSPEHQALFEQLVADKSGEYEEKFSVKYDVSFSIQKPSTDTVAAAMDNTPFRDKNDKLLFRPGGHGALIENLNDVDADVVFIKNIDNVVPDSFKCSTVIYKKVIAGVLVTLQEKAFRYLEQIETGKYTHAEVEEMIHFLQDDLCIKNPDTKLLEDAELILYIKSKLLRPLRVCYIGIRWNSLLGIHNFKAEGEGAFARNRQAWYKRLCEKMVTELCTRYGDLYMIWFDGGADDPRADGPDVEPIVNKYQPNCLFYHNIDRADFRWGGSETGTVEYPCWSTFPVPCSHHKRIESSIDQLELLKHGDKNGKYWVPAMADTPLRGANGRHEWFWEPDDENNIYPLNTLMDKYEKSVGRNATLILGLTPDPTGLIPAGDAQRLKEMGDEINRRFSSPIARISGQKKSLTLKLGKEQSVNYCIIQENIKNGERIRQYQIEAKVNGKWQTVCKGESVGHKRIEKFEPVEATALRLTVSESVALPDIINFSAYSVK